MMDQTTQIYFTIFLLLTLIVMHKTVRIIYLELKRNYIAYTLTWIGKAEQLSSFMSKEKLDEYLKYKKKRQQNLKK